MSGLRAVVYEADDARAVADRLMLDGYEAGVVRERLAGEDDHEDHPWAVLTDAPEAVLEVLVEQYDGWVESDEPPTGERGTSGPSAVPPPDLPDVPRRIKGHFTAD